MNMMNQIPSCETAKRNTDVMTYNALINKFLIWFKFDDKVFSKFRSITIMRTQQLKY